MRVMLRLKPKIIGDEKKGTTVYHSLACDWISGFIQRREKNRRAKRRREYLRFQVLLKQKRRPGLSFSQSDPPILT